MLQKHVVPQQHIDISKYTLLKEAPATEYLYIIVSDKPSENKYHQAVQKYFSKSKALQEDFQSRKSLKIYSFDDQDPFQSAYLIRQTQNDGAVLNDVASGNVKLSVEQLQSQENQVTVILPDDYTPDQLNQLIYQFRLANYTFSEQSIKVDTKIKNYTFQYLNIVTQIEEKLLDVLLETDIKVAIRQAVVQPILNVRQLVSTRANVATTTYMRDHAIKLAKDLNLEYTVIEGNQLLEQNLNLIHAVGRASEQPPLLFSVSYNGNKDNDQYLALIGKGIVFDCGGLSIKGNASMETMYCDKTGACTVLEAFRAIVQLKLPINVVCTVAFCENSISNNAYRVSDIIHSYKGITVEVLNTDAEGRLVLADCMSYTQHHYKVNLLIELSTLTGTVTSAIGKSLAGLFTNKHKLVKEMKKISKLSGDEFWHLPLNDEHRSGIKSTFADIANSGGKSGASNAAAFLEYFVEKGVQWMHWDIASVALTTKKDGIQTPGATGFGVQQIVYYAAYLAQKIQLE